jgi:hypothetical protein
LSDRYDQSVIRNLLAASFGAAALLAAGCGGSTATVAGGPGAAADVVPANVAGFLAFRSDADDEQVERVRELVERFPGAKAALAGALRDALDDGTWAEDVDPAVGDEVAVVFLDGSTEPIVLTQPDDVGKLEELARKADADVEVRELDGWHAVGEAKALDALARAGDETLADSDAYGEAFEDLETDVVARFYGRGDALGRVAGSLPGAAVPTAGGFETFAGVVEALEDGLRVEGRVTGLEQEVSTYEPTLLERVPDDAFLAASIGDVGPMTAELRKGAVPFLPDIERALGVTLDELAAVLGAETVLYARKGIGIPEVTLASRPDDPAAAVETLRKVARAASDVVGGRLRTTTTDGVEVHVLQVEIVQIQFAAVDDVVVVTSGATGLRDFRRDGDKLSGSDRFEEATEDAGYEGETSGLLYVDLRELLPVVEGIAGFSGADLPEDVRSGLERLDTFAAHSSADGDSARYGAVFRTR